MQFWLYQIDLTPRKVRIVFFCVRKEYYSWAMLAPRCPDRHARPDAHAYCHASSSCDCAPRLPLLLCLAGRACAWARLPACEREREGAQHAYPNARGTEHSARAQIRARPMRERGREGAQRACPCVDPAACATVGNQA
jgi:hypothetical protein